MATPQRFPEAVLGLLDQARIVGVRAGSSHRYTGVWIVVVERRVFARSWNNKPTGWYAAFRAEPLGSIQVGDTEIAVRARQLRSERLQQAVSVAYAGKYNTKASRKWVLGFEEPERQRTTIEFVQA